MTTSEMGTNRIGTGLGHVARAAAAFLLAGAWAFLPAPASAASKLELDANVQEAIQNLYKTSSAAKSLAARSAGILVFPAVYKGGIGIGAEYGEGALLTGGHTQAYYNLVSASFGWQLGAQQRSIAVLFMTPEALAKFRRSEGWKAGVDGSVAIATLGAGTNLDTETMKKPIIGFIYSDKGLMFNLTLEGSKISRIEKD